MTEKMVPRRRRRDDVQRVARRPDPTCRSTPDARPGIDAQRETREGVVVHRTPLQVGEGASVERRPHEQ